MNANEVGHSQTQARLISTKSNGTKLINSPITMTDKQTVSFVMML